MTISGAFPIPYIDDVLSAMQGARYFSTIDMKSGFCQLPMDPQSTDKAAFITAQEHYEFVRMSFGLKNATATLQRAMTKILRPAFKQGTRLFINDMVFLVLLQSSYWRGWTESLDSLLQKASP